MHTGTALLATMRVHKRVVIINAAYKRLPGGLLGRPGRILHASACQIRHNTIECTAVLTPWYNSYLPCQRHDLVPAVRPRHQCRHLAVPVLPDGHVTLRQSRLATKVQHLESGEQGAGARQRTRS